MYIVFHKNNCEQAIASRPVCKQLVKRRWKCYPSKFLNTFDLFELFDLAHLGQLVHTKEGLYLLIISFTLHDLETMQRHFTEVASLLREFIMHSQKLPREYLAELKV